MDKSKAKTLTLIESYTGPGGITGVVVFQSDYNGPMRDLLEYLNGYQGLSFTKLTEIDDGQMHG